MGCFSQCCKRHLKVSWFLWYIKALWYVVYPDRKLSSVTDHFIYSMTGIINLAAVLHQQLEQFKTAAQSLAETVIFCFWKQWRSSGPKLNLTWLGSGTSAWFKNLITHQSLLVTSGSCSVLLLFSYSQQVSDTLSLVLCLPKGWLTSFMCRPSFGVCVCVCVCVCACARMCVLYIETDSRLRMRLILQLAYWARSLSDSL